MRWIEQFDLFLFDLDGLLVDTEPLHYEAYRLLCKRYDYELQWDLSQYLAVAHSNSEGLQKALHPHLEDKQRDWKILYEEKKQIYMELLQKGEILLMPGVEKFLQKLAQDRAKRCVATHSSKEQVDWIKHALPVLKTIPVWITREDYDDPKPAPDAYLKAMELLADPGDRVIGFEDSLRGIQALKNTMAFPVLICDPAHPQLQKEEMAGVSHFPSFEKIPSSFIQEKGNPVL